MAYLLKTEEVVTVEFHLMRGILWKAEIRARWYGLTFAEHFAGCLSYHAHCWRSNHPEISDRDYLWEPGAVPRGFTTFEKHLGKEFRESMPAKDAGMTRAEHESAIAEILRTKFSYRAHDATAVVASGQPPIAA
jgi:hypothetical protein